VEHEDRTARRVALVDEMDTPAGVWSRLEDMDSAPEGEEGGEKIREMGRRKEGLQDWSSILRLI
jgi:hypothetical protein